MTFWKSQNYGDSNYGEQWQLKIGGGGGWYLEEGREEQVEPEDFQDSETILYDTVMMDTCHYTFLKTHRRQKNPNGNYRLQLLTVFPHWFINCNTPTH